MVLDLVPESEKAASVKTLDFDHALTERALGVQWNVLADTFSFRIAKREKPATRRGILSVVSSVYDPLGVVSPFILPAKAILQNLCRKRIGWDDEIPTSDLQYWTAWLEYLPKLEQFEIDRCLKGPASAEIVSYELHHFADASEKGYGAVSYLRQTSKFGEVHCSLVMAKSRVAPLKPMTIPRMELSDAVLATRLHKIIKGERNLPLASSTFWTDNTCVLRYIENEDKRFQTFVANRVAAILDQSLPAQWRHVDTGSNPADDASRGMSADSLLESQRWKYGPDFLKQPRETWPQRPVDLEILLQDDPEIKRESKSYANSASPSLDPITKFFQFLSSWTRLRKAVAWVLRCKETLRARIKKRKVEEPGNKRTDKVLTPISVDELNAAEREILTHIQRQNVPEELLSLMQVKTTTVKKSSSIYKLDPILDLGLIRVGGRLQRAPIDDEAKHQVILLKKHYVSDLIVKSTLCP